MSLILMQHVNTFVSANTSQKQAPVRKRSSSKVDSDNTILTDNHEEDWETCIMDLTLIAKAWLDCNPKRGDGWKNLDLRHLALCVAELLARKAPAVDLWESSFKDPQSEMNKVSKSNRKHDLVYTVKTAKHFFSTTANVALLGVQGERETDRVFKVSKLDKGDPTRHAQSFD